MWVLRVRYGVVLLGAVVLTGCSGGESTTEDASPQPSSTPSYLLSTEDRKSGFDAQAALLADGEAGEEDYLLAIDRVSECLMDFDINVANHGWNPVDNQVMILTFKSETHEGAAVEPFVTECQAVHIDDVVAMYGQQHPAEMAEDLLGYTHDCLEERGVPNSAADQNLQQIASTAGASHTSHIAACVDEGLAEHYSELPAVSMGW